MGGFTRRWLMVLSAFVVVIAGTVVLVVSRDTNDTQPIIEVDGTLVRYNEVNGRIDILDGSGSTLASSVIPKHSWVQAGPRGTVLFGDRDRASILHLDTGRSVDLSVDGSNLAAPSRAGDAVVVFYRIGGGDVFIVDVDSGSVSTAREQLDRRTSSFAIVSDHDDALLLSSPIAPSTLVVPRDGAPISIIDGRVDDYSDGTALIVDAAGDADRSTVSISTGSSGPEPVSIDGQVRGGVLSPDGGALVITSDGREWRVDDVTATAEVVGDLGSDVWTANAAGTDRIFVTSEAGTWWLLAADGQIVQRVDLPASEVPGRLDGRDNGRCVLSTGASIGATIGQVLDLRTGDVVATVDNTARLFSTPDGCSAASGPAAAATTVVINGVERDVEGFASIVALSPDLTRMVAVDADGDASLIDVSTGEAVADLGQGEFFYVLSVAQG